MKKTYTLFCVLLALFLPSLGLAGHELELELPPDAQMIENIRFDDGDFIETWQLAGGASIQLLRYSLFSMSLEELMSSEWTGANSVVPLSVPSLGGNSNAVRFSCEEGGESLIVTLLCVRSPEDTLIWQAVYPSRLGEEQIVAMTDGMLSSMRLRSEDEAAG